MVGTMTMAAAARYSRAVDAAGPAAADGRGWPSSSSPLIARTSMSPLPRTSASSSEPRNSSCQRGRRVLPVTIRVTLCSRAYARISSATLARSA